MDDDGDRHDRQDAGRDQPFIERPHDPVIGAEPDKKGADDRGDDAHRANGERQQQHPVEQRLSKEDRSQKHCRDDRHDIGFEQIRSHAGAVADIVADIVGDDRRVARIVLGNAGLDLADEVGADIGALGKDAAAEPREDRDQRGAEAKRHHRFEDRAQILGRGDRAQDEIIAAGAEECRARPPACR